jgi:hypothetical protein
VAATKESQARTSAFARHGTFPHHPPHHPRGSAPDIGALAADFFKSDLTVSSAGAALLLGGLLIIAFHQYRSSVTAVLISVFGWVLAPRRLHSWPLPNCTSAPATPWTRSRSFSCLAPSLRWGFVGRLAKPASPTQRTIRRQGQWSAGTGNPLDRAENCKHDRAKRGAAQWPMNAGTSKAMMGPKAKLWLWVITATVLFGLALFVSAGTIN